jgi:hypothetical protein
MTRLPILARLALLVLCLLPAGAAAAEAPPTRRVLVVFATGPSFSHRGSRRVMLSRVPVRLEWVRTPDVPLKAGLSADVTVRLRRK